MDFFTILSGCVLILAGVVMIRSCQIMLETATECSYLYSKTKRILILLCGVLSLIASACAIGVGIMLLI